MIRKVLKKKFYRLGWDNSIIYNFPIFFRNGPD